MKNTNGYTEKPEQSLQEIRSIMAKPCPCEITQRLPLNPGVEEAREFMTVTELWADRLESFED